MILFLSEPARNKLRMDAYYYGYKRRDVGMRGVSKYLEALSKLETYDNRPEYVKEDAEIREQLGLANVSWFAFAEPRSRSLLHLSIEAEKQLVAIALRHGITSPRNPISPTTVISAVVEALAGGWLGIRDISKIKQGEYAYMKGRLVRDRYARHRQQLMT